MKKTFKNNIFSAVAAVLIALSICVPVFAEDNSGEKKGSISVTLTEQGEGHKPVAGAELILHRVGEIREGEVNQAFVLTSKFKGSGVDLSDLKAEGLAKDLTEYAIENRIAGTTKKTDSEGAVLFENLIPGLYLVMEEKPAQGYYPIAPFLVSVPMTSQDGAKWVYDVDASPKVEPTPLKPTPPDAPKPPPMIQTGQLRWPVPVLAVAGIILFAIGWALTYLKGKKDPEE